VPFKRLFSHWPRLGSSSLTPLSQVSVAIFLVIGWYNWENSPTFKVQPSRRRQVVPPKHQYLPTRQHGVERWKITIKIIMALRT
jgi:hypothetical protein